MKSIIIYATKYGSAAEAANRIKAGLGDETQLCNIMTSTVRSLDAYDTVVIGGSVYIGKVQKQITEYCNGHLSELLNKNVGLFLCAGERREEAQQKQLQTLFPEALYQHAVAKGVLGYAYSFEKMKFFDRIIMKKIKGDSISVAEYSDEKIDSFIKSLKSSGEKAQ